MVHNGIVYLSGQIDGTADDVVGKILADSSMIVLRAIHYYIQHYYFSQDKQRMSWPRSIGTSRKQGPIKANCSHLPFGSRILKVISEQ